MFIMHYSYTFQIYHFEEHHKGYLDLSKETMFRFGTGSSVIKPRRYIPKMMQTIRIYHR